MFGWIGEYLTSEVFIPVDFTRSGDRGWICSILDALKTLIEI